MISAAKFPLVFAFLCFALALAGCSSSSAPPTFTIGGTVVNLASAGGVVLQNGGQTLTVTANGSFTFAMPAKSLSLYSVTIAQQPTSPAQICGVTNGSGMVAGNVTNVEVNCGHNEWAWTNGSSTANGVAVYGSLGIPAAGNTPGARQSPATWTDNSGNFWLFGGRAFIAKDYSPTNDLWEYSGGQWVWVGGLNGSGASGVYGTLGVPSASNVPGSRWEAVTWTDSTGNLWLLGGTGLDSAGTQGDLNDLWKYSGGEWTWMGGSNLVNQQGSYGTLGVTAEGDFPGARHGALGWVDSSGNFWLFGGIGLDVAGTMQGMFNDLWKYSSGEWTWVSGSDLKDQAAVYGTMGAAAPTNVPGARCSLSGWVDSSGGLWLFGGDTFSGMLNDLWKFSNGEWTWVSGANTAGQGGIYGVRGTPGAGNLPGARQLAVSWTDRAGNFWLFGGNGPDSAANEGLLNDLWKYSNGQWTWVSGSNIVDQSGAYGTQGILAPANIPGARIEAESFIDASGNLWLFGGYGVVPNSDTNFNDLWMYMP